MIGWGHIFGSQVSAAGSQARVTRFRFGKSAIRHLSSMQRSIQPSTQSSTQSSMQPSVIDSALCHRFSHPFSPPPLRVAGGSPRWRVAALFHPALHSALRHRLSPLSSIQPSIQPSPTSGGRWQPQVAGGSASSLPHRLSHLSSVLHSALRPFRPYQDKLGQHAVLPLPKAGTPPILDTPNSIVSGIRPTRSA
jgi:hypothetical protein